MADDPNKGSVGASGTLDATVIRKDGTTQPVSQGFLARIIGWLTR